jgi:hypothetical protein
LCTSEKVLPIVSFWLDCDFGAGVYKGAAWPFRIRAAGQQHACKGFSHGTLQETRAIGDAGLQAIAERTLALSSCPANAVFKRLLE